MQNRTKLLFLLVLFLTFGCSRSGREVVPITPGKSKPDYMEYFEHGKEKLNNGEIDEAIGYFHTSLELNEDYSPSGEYLGEALLLKADHEEAFKVFLKVLTQNAYSEKARIGVGRVHIAAENFSLALEAFDIVIGMNNTNAEAHFYRGIALNETDRIFSSKTSFIRAVINDDTYRQTIAGIISLNDNEVAKLFKREYLAIEGKTAINRADLAAILATILSESSLFSGVAGRREFTPPMIMKPADISDLTEDYWAFEEIRMAIDARLMELYPGNEFKPESVIIKADFASLLQKILIDKFNNRDLISRYIGQNSPFDDLNSAHWAYNACRLSEEFGLLERRSQNTFGIGDSIDGLTAVEALEKVLDLQ